MHKRARTYIYVQLNGIIVGGIGDIHVVVVIHRHAHGLRQPGGRHHDLRATPARLLHYAAIPRIRNIHVVVVIHRNACGIFQSSGG